MASGLIRRTRRSSRVSATRVSLCHRSPRGPVRSATPIRRSAGTSGSGLCGAIA